MRTRFLVTIVVLALMSCIHASKVERPASVENPTGVAFYVGSAKTQRMLEGVEVILFASDGGLEPKGHTDAFGVMSIPRSEMRDGSILLFCHAGHFCGAFRLDSPGFFQYDEHLIQLAPMAFR